MEEQKLDWKKSAVRYISTELYEKETSFHYFRTGRLENLIRSVVLFTDYHLFVEFIDLCIGFNQTPRFDTLRDIALDRLRNEEESVDVRLIKYIANEIINEAYDEFDRDPSNYRLHFDGECYTLLYKNLEGEEIQLQQMDQLEMLTGEDNCKLKQNFEEKIKAELYNANHYIIDDEYKGKVMKELTDNFRTFNTLNATDLMFSGSFSEECNGCMKTNVAKITFDIDAYGFQTQVHIKMIFSDDFDIKADEGLRYVDVVMENLFHETVCKTFQYGEEECEYPFSDAMRYILGVVRGETM